MPGPPKKPTHLRLVTGNASKRKMNKNEPEPEKKKPNIPKHFNKKGRYWFNVIADELLDVGILTSLDAKALELLIEAYVEYRHHCDVLDENGYTYKTTSTAGDVTIKMHPAAALKADAWKRIRAMMTEFGMTPASRSKVSIQKGTEKDPLEEFLSKRK